MKFLRKIVSRFIPQISKAKVLCIGSDIYNVRGTSPETKRVRTETVVVEKGATDEEIKTKSGLLNVISIELVQQDYPTEAQIKYAHKLGIYLDDSYNKWDVSCLISKQLDEDTNIPVPNNLARYAIENDIYLSQYCGDMRAYNSVFNGLETEDKIKFFLYSVYCYRKKITKFDIKAFLKRYDVTSFVETYINSNKFLESMLQYSGYDFKVGVSCPTRCNACRFATKFLKESGYL